MVSQHYWHKTQELFCSNFPFRPMTVSYDTCCALKFHGENNLVIWQMFSLPSLRTFYLFKRSVRYNQSQNTEQFFSSYGFSHLDKIRTVKEFERKRNWIFSSMPSGLWLQFFCDNMMMHKPILLTLLAKRTKDKENGGFLACCLYLEFTLYICLQCLRNHRMKEFYPIVVLFNLPIKQQNQLQTHTLVNTTEGNMALGSGQGKCHVI